jgi:GAF domain-containing protein
VKDAFSKEVARQGDDDALRAILRETCRITGMGFAAIARVTEERWVVAQSEDLNSMGLNPGDELEIKQTICDYIRDSGQKIVIDDIRGDPEWRTHPVPVLYGIESYVSLPIFLDDGSFYGTLCAIDPKPRTVSGMETIAALEELARQASEILSGKVREMSAG